MTARATNAFVNNGLGHYGQRQIMAAAAPFGKCRTFTESELQQRLAAIRARLEP